MKAIVFQWRSNYDVLTRTTEMFSEGMNKFGIEKLLIKLVTLAKEKYLNQFHKSSFSIA